MASEYQKTIELLIGIEALVDEEPSFDWVPPINRVLSRSGCLLEFEFEIWNEINFIELVAFEILPLPSELILSDFTD